MNYRPQKFLRLTSNSLLKELFTQQGCAWKKLWDNLPPCRTDFMYSEYRELPQAARHNIELIMQEVYSVASSEDGINQLVKTAKFCGLELAKEFFKYRSRCDKALWFYLRNQNLWEHAMRCAYSDSLSKKYWRRHINLPLKDPKTEKVSLERFGEAISSFYIDSEGRGHGVKVEHFKRSEALDYFFVYLSDHPKVYEVWDAELGFRRKNECHLFELVFAWDHTLGVLEIHAGGGNSAQLALMEIFLHEIMEEP